MTKTLGLIYHSYTGQTEEVLQETLLHFGDTGYQVILDKVIAADPHPSAKDIALTHVPTVESYDRIVLATPVHAFSVPSVMKTYLQSVPSFEGKDVALLVTHHFPFKFLGGKQALKVLKKHVEALGGNVVLRHSIEWSSKHRSREIRRWIEALKNTLKEGKI